MRSKMVSGRIDHMAVDLRRQRLFVTPAPIHGRVKQWRHRHHRSEHEKNSLPDRQYRDLHAAESFSIKHYYYVHQIDYSSILFGFEYIVIGGTAYMVIKDYPDLRKGVIQMADDLRAAGS